MIAKQKSDVTRAKPLVLGETPVGVVGLGLMSKRQRSVPINPTRQYSGWQSFPTNQTWWRDSIRSWDRAGTASRGSTHL